MRLAWLTDVHLNFLEVADRRRFLRDARDQADAFAVSGDIAERPGLIETLLEMEAVLRKPVHFVLGNHDFYGGAIARTRSDVSGLARGRELLTYLTDAGVVALTPRTALIGHDGWADARLGDLDASDVIFNDYVAIEELRKWRGALDLDKPALRAVLNALGDEAAHHFAAVLPEAVARFPSVIAVTHVPPFREAAWYEGRNSDDNFLPHVACRAVGEAMRSVMAANPQSRLLVLCGHTHGSGEARILENLRVLTGAAEYGSPAIQRVFELD
jgi:3',5'-cyclic AMP phosphodiesterase CpdA